MFRVAKLYQCRGVCGEASVIDMTTFAVLGSGGWGTATAILLAQNPCPSRPALGCACRNRSPPARYSREHETVAWRSDSDQCRNHRRSGRSRDGRDCWVSAIPTAYLRDTIARFVPVRTSDVPVVSLTKGLEIGTFRRPTEILGELFKTKRLAALSGPSHAEEVARGLPTSVVVASTDRELAERSSNTSAPTAFGFTPTPISWVWNSRAHSRTWWESRRACATGSVSGIMPRPALLTRGMVEMTRFGVSLGAAAETFTGLAGIGDLITTCFSPHGRNRRVGLRLGQGESIASILAGPQVAEGVFTSRSVHEHVVRMGIETPIMTGVYQMVHAGKPPLAVVQDLMTRQQKDER